MNGDQIGGIIRAILPPLVAFGVAKGWVNAGNADWVIASITSIAVAIWSVWTNKPGTVIAPKTP